MAFLPPESSRLGALFLDIVLDWYDGPNLFVARDELDHAYLALAIEDQAYLYVPVSESRLIGVRTGLLPLRDAFASPEVPAVFYVRGDVVHELSASELSDDWLPAEDQWLDETVHSAQEFSDERLGDWARRQQRPLTALRLDQQERIRRTELPLREAGDIMREFQDLLDSFTREAGSSDEALRDSEYGLLQLAAGSVVLVMAPVQGNRLLKAPTQVMARIQDLITAAADGSERFASVVSEFRSSRTVGHVRDFFESLSDAGTGVTLTVASPVGEVTTTNLPLPTIRTSISVLRTRTELPSAIITGTGRLVGINFPRLTFMLEEARATGGRRKPKRFSGKIDSSLLPTVEGIRAGTSTSYNFRLVEEREVAEFTDEPGPPRYRLVEIAPTAFASLETDEGTQGTRP